MAFHVHRAALIQEYQLYGLLMLFLSTGGSEWLQEDVIELKNIFIPDPKAEIDLSCIWGAERKISQVLSSENFFKVLIVLGLSRL